MLKQAFGIDNYYHSYFDDKPFDNSFTPEDFWKIVSEGVEGIVDSFEEMKPTLVVSENGVNRAPAIAIAYLILYDDMSYDDAFFAVADANKLRTRALLKQKNLSLPEDQITFPTLTNHDFKTALMYIKGAFEEGEENEETVRYFKKWEAMYHIENVPSLPPSSSLEIQIHPPSQSSPSSPPISSLPSPPLYPTSSSASASATDNVSKCGHCGKEPEKPQKCGKCRSAVYCGRECQVADW
eukprot:CAMPEP_0174274316 /NCGR_PEP_ID=MMETSP0439-20130205/57512_1 /TAXON_ID=0 /ORGANISM="Stereomyxa ramosa, Strain Chinc5" /LENGTH=238 /DNA_ID=CAMNT_0015365993 /DNA_START=98 /DNA_END=811 /DNA_ORIENTATION=-